MGYLFSFIFFLQVRTQQLGSEAGSNSNYFEFLTIYLVSGRNFQRIVKQKICGMINKGRKHQTPIDAYNGKVKELKTKESRKKVKKTIAWPVERKFWGNNSPAMYPMNIYGVIFLLSDRGIPILLQFPDITNSQDP
uniref:Uncharacterized protein n=1 Tax=Meloidogyne incognita TaxID=6306 RepID=A0A914KJS6_MELIC